jgi:hypothetical protein
MIGLLNCVARAYYRTGAGVLSRSQSSKRVGNTVALVRGPPPMTTTSMLILHAAAAFVLVTEPVRAVKISLALVEIKRTLGSP